MLRNRDVVVISPQRWGGMWVSKHWISYELSRRNRVLFVGPQIWLGGCLRSPLRSELARRLFHERRRQLHRNLSLFSPIVYPSVLRKLAIGRQDKYPSLQQLKREIARLGFRDLILLNFCTDHTIIGQLGERTSVYYCVDPAFPRAGEETSEQLTCKKSNLVLAVSEEYRKKLTLLAPGKELHVVPHACDIRRAEIIRNDDFLQEPKDISSLPRPIIGYVGSIHDSVVNVDLLLEVATKRPRWSFVLIGPHSHNTIGTTMTRRNYLRLRSVPNIHLLGPRHYKDVPCYIKFIDVCLILIDIEHFTRFLMHQRTSFKLPQYLAQGKAVVSPPLDELKPLQDLLYLRATPAEYLQGLEQALAEGPEVKQARMTYAAQFSYDNILGQIQRLILESEERRASPKC